MTDLAPVTTADHLARFGVFELDIRTGELRRSGVKVKLQEQPFQLLTFLLERAGEVVGREELRERLWPTDFVDFDHSLNTAVRKLRSALDDTADNPRFIETLSRRGYRFIAPVSWDGGTGQRAAASQTAPPAEEVAIPRPSRRLPILPAIAALLVLAAIATFVFIRRPFGSSAPTVDAVAVLPFANADPNSQHVSDGLTEILIDSLSRVPGLRVMARTTVFGYQREGVDPRRAGEELSVSAVITGRVQPENGGYRIHVELIDVSDGSQLWGSQYRGSATGLADVQSRISDDLSLELRRGLDREQRRLVSPRLTSNPQAYEMYLKGLYAWNKRGQQNLIQAIGFFEKSVELDPLFAAPWTGLASTYGVMVGSGQLLPEVGVPKIIAAARKALELDPNSGEAYVSLATTKYRSDWDFAGAERDYKRALALNPNYATGHQWYSDFLRSMGRFDEARREIDTARKLDPLSMPINTVSCWSLFMERRFREAVVFSQKSPFLPRFGMSQCAVISLFALGAYDEALPIMRKMTPQVPEMEQLYARGGARAVLERAVKMQEAAQSPQFATSVQIAEIYAVLGDTDRAFTWLEKGFQERSSRLTNMNIDPQFDSIRSDPRYIDLLRRIGLPNVPINGPEFKRLQ